MAEIRISDRREVHFARVDIPVILSSGLSTHEKMVYVALCAFASRANTCFPSVKSLAEAASCSERQVFRCLETLEKAGLIERSERYNDKGQTSSEYSILGGKCLTDSHGWVTGSQGGGDSQSDGTRFNELDKNKTSSPSESANESAPHPSREVGGEAREPVAEDAVPLEDVPAAMRSTVEYFLLKTERQWITPGELSAVRALEKRHVPARIQTEIGRAVARYQKQEKPVGSLSLEYVWESLKHQVSLPDLRKAKAGQKQKAEEDPWEKQRQADLEEWERRQAAELERKFGGGDDDGDEGRRDCRDAGEVPEAGSDGGSSRFCAGCVPGRVHRGVPAGGVSPGLSEGEGADGVLREMPGKGAVP